MVYVPVERHVLLDCLFAHEAVVYVLSNRNFERRT